MDYLTHDRIISIFKEVLEVDVLECDRPYCQNGGNSILAMKIIIRLKKEVAINVSVNTFFKPISLYDLTFEIMKNEVV